MNIAKSILFLFPVLLFSLYLSGQQKFEPITEHAHYCIHNKTGDLAPTIYNQDPRVHDFDVKFYGLDLEVTVSSTFIKGSARIIATITKPQSQQLVLELIDDLKVSQVTVNGEDVTFAQKPDILVIELGREYEQGAVVNTEVFYQGQPLLAGFFAGIQSTMNNYNDPVLWTLSEPHNARQWFPCKQVLEDKADSVSITITTPPGFIAASNGLLTGQTTLSDGRLRYEWKSNYPIAYYLISMTVANYQEYSFYAPLSGLNDSVLVQNFIYNYPNELMQVKPLIDQLKPMMSTLSELWGDYPFSNEKYGQAQAPMGGGMEHQTISTMGYFGFDITAHELAHHWYGNNVTCATWSDIWINEGFASYAEYLSREFIQGIGSANQWMQTVHNNIKQLPGGSVYVPVTELSNVNRIFNGRLSYRKGAAILHLLRYEINNDELFFTIMRDFQQLFADSVATGDDFMNTTEKHTGESWQWFFDQWYYGEGYPTYELRWWQNDSVLHIRSSQHASTGITPFFAGTLEFTIITDTEQKTIRFFQDQGIQSFEIPVKGTIKDIIFDPGKSMIKEFSIADTSITDPPLQPSLQVIPNPFSEYLKINSPITWHNGKYTLREVSGKIITEGLLNTQTEIHNLSLLNSGIYILSVSSESGELKAFRLVKF